MTFTLEPALYFGVFDFPGATKSFSYTRLLQVVDISNQTPYRQDVVSKAGENLLQFFVSTGYFQAQVQPEVQFDENHMLANVVFRVNLGKRTKVGEVEVHGPDLPEANRLLRDTRSLRATATGASLKSGKSYTTKANRFPCTREARPSQPTPSRQQMCASNTRAITRTLEPISQNHADIVIDARPGPIVKVRVMGAKLSWLPFLRGRQMKKLIPIFSEGNVDPDLVEDGRRNLIEFFQGKGYFDVKVTTNFQNQNANAPCRRSP